MGVCGSSEAEADAAAAEASARADRKRLVEQSPKLTLHLVQDAPSYLCSPGREVTAWELETAGELLLRVTQDLAVGSGWLRSTERIPFDMMLEQSLVFCDEPVPHETTLKDAGLVPVRVELDQEGG